MFFVTITNQAAAKRIGALARSRSLARSMHGQRRRSLLCRIWSGTGIIALYDAGRATPQAAGDSREGEEALHLL